MDRKMVNFKLKGKDKAISVTWKMESNMGKENS